MLLAEREPFPVIMDQPPIVAPPPIVPETENTAGSHTEKSGMTVTKAIGLIVKVNTSLLTGHGPPGPSTSFAVRVMATSPVLISPGPGL